MKVHAYPGRSNRAWNPYTYLLTAALEAQGVEVIDPVGTQRVLDRADIVHVHWPQKPAVARRLPIALYQTTRSLFEWAAQRAQGARIVWTVHNVHSHERTHPLLERILMWIFVRMIGGAIFLSESTRQAAYREMPSLRGKPSVIIPHGVYGDYYVRERTPEQTRAALGLGDGPVLGFLGEIKPYKGLDLVLQAFERTEDPDITLLIAGRFSDKRYGAAMRQKIETLRGMGKAIIFKEGRVSDQELVETIAAIDLVALPYKVVWNSGFALLALETGAPILTTDEPIFVELEKELGPEWVQPVRGGIGDAALKVVRKAQMSPQALTKLDTFRRSRAWDGLARDTLTFYQGLLETPADHKVSVGKAS